MKKICKSRILSLVLMVVMLFGMLPDVVHAAPDNTVPTVNVSTWEELAAAMEEDSTTNIVVTQDIVFNEARTKKHPYDNGIYYNGNDYVVEVKGNHTVDLNGKKVDIRTDKDTSHTLHLLYMEEINRDYYIGRTIYLFHVYNGAAVTMKDSSAKQTGSLRFHAYIEEWDLGEISGAYASMEDRTYQTYRYTDRDSQRVLFDVYKGSVIFDSGKYIAGRSKQQWVSWAIKHQEDSIYTGIIDDYHGYAYHLIGGGIARSRYSDITVLDGEFEGRRGELFRLLNGSLTINDGYFDNRCFGTIINNVADAVVNVYGGKFRGGTYDWALSELNSSGRAEVREGYTTDNRLVVGYVDWDLYNVKHNGKTYTNKEDYANAVKYKSLVESVITEEVVPKNKTEVSKDLSDAVISFIPSGEGSLEGSVQSEAISFYPGQKGLIQTNMEEIRYFAADAGAEVTGEWSIRFAKKGAEDQYEEPVSCSVAGDASFELDSYMTVNKAPFKLNEMEPGSKAILQVTLTETLGKVQIVHRGEAELEVQDEKPLQKAQLIMKNGSGSYGSTLMTGTELEEYSICPEQNTVTVFEDKWIDMTTKVAAMGEVENGKRYSKLIAVTAAPGYYLDNTFTLGSPYTNWKIVPIRFDERAHHKVAFYQVIVPTENSPISALNLCLPDAAYKDGHLVPGTTLQDLQFGPSVGNTTAEVQFWLEGGKEAENSQVVKGLGSYKAMVKLSCGSEEIFDSELVVKVAGRTCELLGVSENGMEAYIFTPTLVASCEHIATGWVREETEHWKNCIVCGERFEEGEHAWEVASSMRNLEIWKCAVCGAQTRLVKDAVELKKIVVDIPYPTAGEVITPVTIAPQFEGMAKVVTSKWYKGDSKQPITLGTAKFEKGVNYYVTVQIKTEYGYTICADTEQTVLTNSGVYVKSTDFGSGDEFQIYDRDAGNIQAQFHYISMEKVDSELTLPEAKVGMTYEELIKGIKLTNSAGHLVTIKKDGVEDACASVVPLSDTMTVVAFKDGYNNKGSAPLQSGRVYTVVTEVTLTNGAILSKNVKTADRGNAANVVITDGVSGPIVMATYAIGTATQKIGYAALTMTPPMAGNYPAKAVSDIADYTVASEWEMDANTAFEAGKTYRVLLTLTAAEGRKFAEDTIVMVNGKPAGKVSLVSENKLSALVTLTAPAAKQQVIQGYRFTVDEPVVGESIHSHKVQGISKIGNEGDCMAWDDSWTPSVGNFVAGKSYTLSITMQAKENCLFAENAVFYLNGSNQQFTVVSGLGTDTVKLEYTFPSLFGIISQPKDMTVVDGQKASFTVKAYGEDMTYQWQFSKDGGKTWVNSTLTSAKKATFSLTSKESYSGRLYRCVMTAKEGSLTSDTAKLTVKPAPAVITTHPVDTTAAVGKNAEFSVEATGEGLSYQWQYSKNGTTWTNSIAENAKTPTLSFTAKESFNGRIYRCAVKNEGGTVYSNTATLTVKPAAPALAITTQPEDVSAVDGEAVSFCVVATGENLTYQWQYSKDGGTTWTNNTVSSAKKATLSLTAKETWNGRLYRCIVSDGVDSITTETASLTVNSVGPAEPQITTQPVNVTTVEGETVTFTVEATGEGLTYQWQYSKDGGVTWVNNTVSSAKKATLSLTAKESWNGRLYHCIVTNEAGSVTSDAATLVVNPAGPVKPVITKQPTDVTAVAGEKVTFSVVAEGATSYQWQYSKDSGNTWINSTASSAQTANLETTVKASFNGRIYRCVVTNEAGSVNSATANLTVN